MPAADSNLIGASSRTRRCGHAAGLALLATLLGVQPHAQAADAPAVAASTLSSTALRVHAFSFSGNTVFSTAHLTTVAIAYTQRDLGDADLQALQQQLTDLYVQAGLPTSRATLPDQDGRDGVLRIAIVEGFLEQIEVSGSHVLNPADIAARLQIGLTTPLNVAVLNTNLRLLMNTGSPMFMQS